MVNEIVSYNEMCRRESSSLQRGMNFDVGKGYSVILVSVRPNAPYRDRFENDGSTLIYEGHDAPYSEPVPDPKAVDQPEFAPGRSLTPKRKVLPGSPGVQARGRTAVPGQSVRKDQARNLVLQRVIPPCRRLARARSKTRGLQVQVDSG
jgi:hypothetical protein